MNLKLILCNVFRREICLAMLNSPNNVFPVFTEIKSHTSPDALRRAIQKEIDNTSKGKFDHILLGYGLCGNAAVGLTARDVPLVIPRAHDCCTILLGSRARFRENFGHRPSCRWRSGGTIENGEDYLRGDETFGLWVNADYQALIDKYGVENAEYLMETLAPKDGNDKHTVYIRTDACKNLGYEEKAKADAAANGTGIEFLEGDNRLLQMLVNADWPKEEFLIVPPGSSVVGVYDHAIVMKAVP